jgi:protein ImuB
VKTLDDQGHTSERTSPGACRASAGGPQLSLLTPMLPERNPEAAPVSVQPLWLAVDLPHLALDALAQTGSAASRPLIITEDSVRPRVHDANRAARESGVRPGMALADALAVLNAPIVLGYEPGVIRQHLQTLATVLLQFTDHVCPEPGERRILLEVGRSLRLFRGTAALEARLRETLRQLGYTARIGIARTPAAARLLARLRHPTWPLDRDELRRTLAPLPLAILPLPEADIYALHGIGLERIGDLLRLPRDDLTLRYGARLPQLIDRLLGDLAEPMPRFRPPETPVFQLEFDQEVSNTGALRFPLKRLLLQLEQVLRAGNQCVQSLELQLRHRGATTRLTLERSQPGSRAEEWLELWSIRLSRLELPAPVRGLHLAVPRLLPAGATPAELFSRREGARDESGFLTRLRARLGDDAVLRFTPTLHPLPEDAQEPCGTEAFPALPSAVATPAQHVAGAALWLCPLQPSPPPGPLEWLGRMEGGWWTGNDQRRDYAVTPDRRGRLCWVFRDLRTGQWQLQGFWG